MSAPALAASSSFSTQPSLEALRAEALDPHTPPEVLARLASIPALAPLVAQHPSTPPKVLAHLLGQSGCGALVAKNPNLSPAQLSEAACAYPWVVAHNPGFALLLLEDPRALLHFSETAVLSLLRSRALAPEILLSLCAHPAHYVRRTMADDPQTPAVVLAALAQHKDAWVKSRAARNPSLPAEALPALFTDESSYVRRIAAKNRHALQQGPGAGAACRALQLLWDAGASRHLDKCERPQPLSAAQRAQLAEGGPFAQVLLARQPEIDDEATWERLATHPAADVRLSVAANPGLPERWVIALSREQSVAIQRVIALHPKLPAALAESFALSHCDFFVRAAAAQNPNLSPERLRELAQKEDLPWLIRQAAARAAGLPEALQESFARDVHPEVRLRIARRDDTRPEVLEILLVDADEEVRASAAKNPNAPAATVALLWRAGASPDLRGFGEPHGLPRAQLRALALRGEYGKALVLLHPDTPMSLWDMLASRSSPIVMEALARSKRTDDSLLSALVGLCPDGTPRCQTPIPNVWKVAPLVARHPNTPLAVRRRLATSGTSATRRAARETLGENLHPKHPRYTRPSPGQRRR